MIGSIYPLVKNHRVSRARHFNSKLGFRWSGVFIVIVGSAVDPPTSPRTSLPDGSVHPRLVRHRIAQTFLHRSQAR